MQQPIVAVFSAVILLSLAAACYSEGVEQMPNPGFALDTDKDGKPDGYENCAFAPREITSPAGGRVAQIRDGTTTRIHQPQPGPYKLFYWIRSADATPRTVTPKVEFRTADGTPSPSAGRTPRMPPCLVRSDWKEVGFTLTLNDRTEWVRISWEIKPDRPVYLAAPSFRSAVQTGGYERIAPGLHPHVFFNKDDVPRLRQKTQQPTGKDIWKNVKDSADKVLSSKFPKLITGNREKSVPQARSHAYNARLLSFVYLITGNEQYAERAKREADDVLQAESWVDARHKGDADLVSASISFSLSLVYDWLYDYLSPADRAQLRDVVFQRGLLPIFRDSATGVWWSNWYRCNWGAVIHGQAGAAAMAYLGEDPRVPTWIQTAKEKICLHRQEMGRDGGWGEGVSYCCYAWSCATYFMAALKNLTQGKDNLFDDQSLRKAHLFPINLLMPNQAEFVKFSNCGSGIRFSGDYFRRFAAEYQDPHAQWIAGHMYSWNPAVNLFGFLYTDPQLTPVPPSALPLAQFFRDINWGVMRTSWQEPDGLLFAFKGGYNDWDHHHHDLNHFILYAHGRHLITDLGYPHEKWGCLTEAHNTIMVNGQEQLDGVNVAGGRGGADHYCHIREFLHTDIYDHLIGDATQGYNRDAVAKFTREVMFLRPHLFVIFDDLVAAKPSSVDWIVHTFGDLEVNGNVVTITQDDAAVDIFVLAPTQFKHEIHSKDWKEVGIRKPFETAKADTFVKIAPMDKVTRGNFLAALMPRRRNETPHISLAPIAGEQLFGMQIGWADNNAVALFSLDKRGITYGPFISDARSCYVNYSPDGVNSFALHQGTHIRYKGKTLFQSESTLPGTFVWREGKLLRRDTP